jgi:hypothetical protein
MLHLLFLILQAQQPCAVALKGPVTLPMTQQQELQFRDAADASLLCISS